MTLLAAGLVVGFLIQVVAYTIFFTWLYNRTAGSLLPMRILHASIHTSQAIPTFLGFGSDLRPFLFYFVFTVVAAVALIAVGRTARFRGPWPERTPQPYGSRTNSASHAQVRDGGGCRAG